MGPDDRDNLRPAPQAQRKIEIYLVVGLTIRRVVTCRDVLERRCQGRRMMVRLGIRRPIRRGNRRPLSRAERREEGPCLSTRIGLGGLNYNEITTRVSTTAAP